MRSLLFASAPAAFCALAIVTSGCGDADDGTGTGGGGGTTTTSGPPEPLPALSKAPLTTDERIVPTKPQEDPYIKDTRIPADMDELLAQGYGDFTLGAGEPVMPRTIDDTTPPVSGPNAKLLTRFVHLADIQLADDESPARVVNVDSAQGATGSAFRPQEGHECRILNAAVRTVNRANQDAPIDFLLLGGDNADNAQDNEVGWVLSILGGADSVECDSGDDDDPVAGANNDPKDPFIAAGLDMPWLWVTGNHDVLNQGNFPVSVKTADYVSDYAAVGTRDWSQPGGPMILGTVVPDEGRRGLSGQELMTKVKADGDGHGLSDADVTSGRAFYAFDVEGTPLRIVVLDTTAPTGSAEGLMRQSELDDFVIPTLDAAVADGKVVILTSHHASELLTDGGGFGGIAQPDTVTPADFQDVIGSYPNVLMYLAGHTHRNRIKVVTPTGTPFWEVETSALADWPNQLRVIELWDLDNGFYSIRMIGLDYQTENDPIAADGRARGIVDVTSGWREVDSSTEVDRNVELYVKKN